MKQPPACSGLAGCRLLFLGLLALLAPAQAAELALITEGRPAATIVLGPSPTAVERFAAEELRAYLKAMSGAELPLGGTAPLEVWIGTAAAHPRLAALLPPAELGFDGFQVATVEDRGHAILALTGVAERSPLLATYHLIELLGIHFVGYQARGGETVPRRANVTLPPLHEVEKPAFKYRFASDNNFAASDRAKLLPVIDWAAKNRLDAIMITPGRASESWDGVAIDEIKKRGLLIAGPGHILAQLTPEPALFAQHPEYFPLRHGVREAKVAEAWGGVPSFCFSNAAARRLVVAKAIAYVRAHPYLDLFAIYPPDGSQHSSQCECAECARLAMSDWYLTLLNEISGALQTERPGMKCLWISYNECSVPPREVRPVDHGRDFILFWCNELRDLHEPMDSEANRRPPRLLQFKPRLPPIKTDWKTNPTGDDLAALPRWRRWSTMLKSSGFQGDVVVLDYYNQHVGHSLNLPWLLYAQSGPWPDGLLQKDFACYAREGIAGWQNCTDYFNDSPDPYWNRLSAALLWNPALDLAAFDRTFYEQWYGPAAAPMQRYSALLWHELGQTTAAPADAASLEALAPLLNEAEALARDPQTVDRLRTARQFYEHCRQLKRELPMKFLPNGDPCPTSKTP